MKKISTTYNNKKLVKAFLQAKDENGDLSFIEVRNGVATCTNKVNLHRMRVVMEDGCYNLENLNYTTDLSYPRAEALYEELGEMNTMSFLKFYEHINSLPAKIIVLDGIEYVEYGGSNCLQKSNNIHRNRLKTLAFYY